MSADQSAMETLRQLPQYMNMDLTDTVDSPMDATVSGESVFPSTYLYPS